MSDTPIEGQYGKRRKAGRVPGTIIPYDFLPFLGLINVRHTRMANAVDNTIMHLLGLNTGLSYSLLSPIESLNTRLIMLKKLTSSCMENTQDKCKMQTILKKALAANEERNTVIHDWPLLGGGDLKSITLEKKSKVLSHPMSKWKTEISIESLKELASRMLLIEEWFNKRYHYDEPNFVPHPDWLNDSVFPWRDEYEKLLKSAESSVNR